MGGGRGRKGEEEGDMKKKCRINEMTRREGIVFQTHEHGRASELYRKSNT